MIIATVILPHDMLAEIFDNPFNNTYGIALKDSDADRVVSGSVSFGYKSIPLAMAAIQDKFMSKGEPGSIRLL